MSLELCEKSANKELVKTAEKQAQYTPAIKNDSSGVKYDRIAPKFGVVTFFKCVGVLFVAVEVARRTGLLTYLFG